MSDEVKSIKPPKAAELRRLAQLHKAKTTNIQATLFQMGMNMAIGWMLCKAWSKTTCAHCGKSSALPV